MTSIQTRYRIPLLAGCVLMSFNCASFPSEKKVSVNENASGRKFSSRNLIVYCDPEIGKAPLLKAVQHYKAEIFYDYQNFNAVAIKIPANKNLEKAQHYFKKIKGVILVNKDEIVQIEK